MPMSRKNDPISKSFNSLWKFFASIQLTVVVLLSLAVTSTIGTLVPQNQSPEQYYRAFGDFLFRLFSVLDIFDMYHAWWFQLLLILLGVNLTVCSIDRLSATWSIIFPEKKHFSPNRFRKLKKHHRFKTKLASEKLKPMLSSALSKSFGYLKLEDTPEGFMFYAEKGRLSRLGVYVVHFSVLLLLVGGLIGSFWGFEAFVALPEGESVDSVKIRNTGETRELGFTVRCDNFSLSKYPNGTPKEFKSSLTVLENGNTVLQKDIIVNDPLRYKNINFFQSSYGEMPSASPSEKMSAPKEAPEKIVLGFTSSESQMTYRKEIAVGQKIDLPEGLGTFLLMDYQPDAKFRGQDIGPALIGVMNPDSDESQEVLLPLHFPNFDKMRRGQVVISVENHETKTFKPDSPPEVRYYTGLQVTNDPGVHVVYIGFVMMIVGCYISFFMSHQQVFVEFTETSGKGRIFVSGISNKDKFGMHRKVAKLSDKLKTLIVQS